MNGLRTLVVVGALAMTACSSGGSAPVVLSADGVTEVEVGDELVIELAENPSVGDAWEVTTPPDRTVARLLGETYEADAADPQATGVGGTRSFRLEAVGAGETVVVVHNCYRCDAAGTTPPEDAHEAQDRGYRILVR